MAAQAAGTRTTTARVPEVGDRPPSTREDTRFHPSEAGLLRLPDPLLELVEDGELSGRTGCYRGQALVELEVLIRVLSHGYVQDTSNRSTVFAHLDPRRLVERPRLHKAKWVRGPPRFCHLSPAGSPGRRRRRLSKAAPNETHAFAYPHPLPNALGQKTDLSAISTGRPSHGQGGRTPAASTRGPDGKAVRA
jgi:hypothetical protein